MLEVQNLSKIYRPKKGVPVRALDQVSISFPDTGMVFLLGKSGSGKSTLLNLLGGLDAYDEGDILINGNSSKDFRQGDFDSYRNTFVGFIFQEYNVLEEFTVGANIALALELQGKKATDEAINAILEQVDLAGYGDRRPNELSGGQKQRVAIARALVKSPKIIMADEPTGALDSTTGRAVLDTLKKLSAEKLVITVSHDREFAMQYADRIIELADGKVVSDREYYNAAAESVPGPRYEGNTVVLPRGYHLTEEDRAQINAYLDGLQTGDLILIPQGETVTGRQSREAEQAPSRTKGPLALIRSRLPMKAAFRIGCGALKYKKLRLVITILLSCIAFGLFGLADTFGSYDHVTTCTNSLLDTGIGYASLVRQEKVIRPWGDKYYWQSYSPSISEEDLALIEKESGVPVQGVFTPVSRDMDFLDQYDDSKEFTQTDYHIFAYGFSGLASLDLNQLKAAGCSLVAGRLPAAHSDEIAISSYMCETFYIGGYRNHSDGNFSTVRNPGDMIGKTLTILGRDFTVVGVVDTGMDLDRYRGLTEASEGDPTTAEMLVNYALYTELNDLRQYSLAQVGILGKDTLQDVMDTEPVFQDADQGWLEFDYEFQRNGETLQYGVWGERLGLLSQQKNAVIHWLDGERKTLGEKEVIVTADCMREILADLGTASPGMDLEEDSFDWEEVKERLSQMGGVQMRCYIYNEENPRVEEGWQIVGVMFPKEGNGLGRAFLLPEELFDALVTLRAGKYNFAVGDMPATREGVRRLVKFCNEEDGDFRFTLQNPVTYELETVHEVLVILARVFLYVGLGFALFAALMLSNFIATSITYKKQEIGILRAIGARGNDVFRIFFSESFVIAMINFVLSATGTFIATALVNYFIRSRARVLITVLSFGPRQILLLFGISLLVAAVASFVPVKRIASKRPIDAIRGR